MGALPRFARLVVLVGIVSGAVAVLPALASAENVKAKLTFADGDAVGTPQPIRRATVEIWSKTGGFWHADSTVETSEQGTFDVPVPSTGAGTVYGLRVYAINPAAIVRFRDRPQDAMYAQPGPPGAEMQTPSKGPSDTIEFNWNFTDPATVGYFNTADALLYGRDYALTFQAEPALIKQLTVMPHSSPTTFYDRYVHWLRVDANLLIARDDPTILHEYGHFLEEQLSTFGPAIATDHDGCNVYLSAPGGPHGAHAESMDFAWMEGFSDYFGQAAAAMFNNDGDPTTNVNGPVPGTATTGEFSVPQLETPSCLGSDPLLPREFLELPVAGALWDLHDRFGVDAGALPEPADRLCDKDGAIFRIFDTYLQQHPANIQTFTDGWVDDGQDVPAFLSLLSAIGVNVTTPPVKQYYSPKRAADQAVWRASEGGAWYIYGRTGPHWGQPGDIPVPADYDGDGFTDAAVYRHSTSEWFVLLSASGGHPQVTRFGQPGDIPLPADYDGDREVDFAVYRPAEKAVHVFNDSCGPERTIPLIGSGGVPVVGEIDGDRRADPGLYNPLTGTVAIRATLIGQSSWTLAANAEPAIADYDADGKDDLATFTPRQRTLYGTTIPGGIWTIRKSRTGTVTSETWGGTAFNEAGVPADYDGDGRADLAVYNRASGNWTVRRSLDGTNASDVQWGAPGDIPIPR
jgi:hypothetical protein